MCVRGEQHLHVQICVGAGRCVGVCHVFAVISFSCRLSQDLCYTVCSACQARLRLRSNSQYCATVGEKNEFFSADLLCKGSKHTHWYGYTAALKVDCLRVFLTAGQKTNFYPVSALDILQDMAEIKSEKSAIQLYSSHK